MPQVVEQLEALVCGGGCGDGKIVCETTLLGPAGDPMPGEPPLSPPPPDTPDQPAESFWLHVKDEIDWVDRNAAAFYDRDDSTKGITNPKSQHHHNGANPNPGAKLHSSSQRYAAKPKAPIIGLPNKLQHSGYLGQSARRHAVSGRIFPKKARGAAQRGKSAVPEAEPTSPKVSCIGRVLSDRDRNRCRKVCRKGTSEVSRESSSTATTPAGGGKRTGFWRGLLGFSCYGRGKRLAVIDEEESLRFRTTKATAKTKITPSAGNRDRSSEEAEDAVTAAAPGLGAMTRFASGRRSASWGGEVELEAVLVAKSGPLPQKQSGAGILGRRSGGSLEELDCDRDWKNAGPASV